MNPDETVARITRLERRMDDIERPEVLLVGSTAAPADAEYLVNAASADLSAEVVVTAARGSIIYGNATPAWAVLAVGGANAFLRTDGTDVSWSTGFLAITATKTLTVSDSTTLANAAITFAAGHVLTMAGNATLNQDLQTTNSPTFANVYVPDGGFVGVSGADGWTFDSSNGDISCASKVGVNNVTPTAQLHTQTSGAAVIGAIIQGSVSQSANLTEWQNSAPSTIAYINKDGGAYFSSNTGIGAAPIANYRLYVTGAVSAADANNYYGVAATRTFTHAAGIQGGVQYGVFSSVSLSGAGTITDARGYFGGVYASSGTITSASGVRGYIQASGTGAYGTAVAIRGNIDNVGSGTISNAYSLFAGLCANTGGGQITNLYGLYISSVTAGTNNWAIYTGTGTVRFGDSVLIDSDTASLQLGADQDIKLLSAGPGDLTITPAADTDIVITFTGTTNTGQYSWMEDEDYFRFADDILLPVDERVYFGDTNVSVYSNDDGYLDLEADTGIRVNNYVRHTTANYRRYYHLPIAAFDPGASGATWTDADANTLSGWELDNAGETLEMTTDVHADWDAASDFDVEVTFTVAVDNSGGNAGDTVDLKLICYYKGEGDTATKTQTVEDAITVGACAQWTQFKHEFTIDYNPGGGNDVDVADVFSLILNLETDTSEVDDIIVNDASFYYHTTHTGIESGDT